MRSFGLSKQIKPFETWVIRNKYTGEYFTACSGKQAWRVKNHASAAWANSVVSGNYWCTGDEERVRNLCEELGVEPIDDIDYKGEHFIRPPYFKEQDVWTHINLTEVTLDERLTKAENLLRGIRNILEYQSEVVLNAIEDYFNE